MDNLILFGGSFDPVHNGHLRMATEASHLLDADIIFIPEKSPKWKKLEASPEDRLKMLELALKTEGNPSLSIDPYDLNLEGNGSYMIDTVRHFKQVYASRELYLLIGEDQVNKLNQWKDIDELSKLIHIIYVTRAGVKLNQSNVDKYQLISLPYDKAGEVSSSKVRELHSVDVSLRVREYIENNQLYYIKKLSRLETPHRLAHSISVANLAYKIALFNHLTNFDKAYIAGLLHDLGKNLSEEEEASIMKKEFPTYSNCLKWMAHQFTGVYLAKTIFGIEDEEILQAIEFHASAKAKMSPLGKIIYAADKIEPTRGYDSRDMIRLCYENYHQGFIRVLKENKAFYESKGMEFASNELTNEAIQYYLGE